MVLNQSIGIKFIVKVIKIFPLNRKWQYFQVLTINNIDYIGEKAVFDAIFDSSKEYCTSITSDESK